VKGKPRVLRDVDILQFAGLVRLPVVSKTKGSIAVKLYSNVT